MDGTFTKSLRQLEHWLLGLVVGEQEDEDFDGKNILMLVVEMKSISMHVITNNIAQWIHLPVTKTLYELIENMTGIEPEVDSTLDEVGLASVGIPVIVGMLNTAFSNKSSPISITTLDLAQTRTMADIVAVIEKARARIDELDGSVNRHH